MPSLTISEISRSAFTSILARYPDSVPAELRELDRWRYETIRQRHSAHGSSGLRKADVEKLVEWKLKHGKFRPNLLRLVQSNSEQDVEDVLETAYDDLYKDEGTTNALKRLQKLKGIGPATASLILSVWTPLPDRIDDGGSLDSCERAVSGVPFFSDELYRWCSWEDAAEGRELAGWKRKIKYSKKEWDGIRERVWESVKRLGVKAVECEKVAYVLGREGVDVGVDSKEEQGLDLGADHKSSTSTGIRKESMTRVKTKAETTDDELSQKEDNKASVLLMKGKKRKARNGITPPEGPRRSSRRKTSG
ncbi:hypothetical protein K491DRAFT_596312 [Lophiostoma macrostomum CBS 122681]|uniref:DNA glycosylase n=1 Tax=Lophiostoma macrostomum CBS 122681 TaxID=1314788 RepID=A0A6A6TA17_9PLEO|nr:hypothetical protein K491DRAFT_596312 [Lophiostoma macrostomum CBS 122681]